jgi:hypothetical protein
MSENTVLLQIPTASMISIFRIIDEHAENNPDAKALGPLTKSGLKDACIRLRTTDDVTTVDPRNLIEAVPATIGNLTNGAVCFSIHSNLDHWRPGEFLFPERGDVSETDTMRLPQDRLLKTAKALAERYQFNNTDRLYVDGPLDDPGTWLVMAAALYAGTPIVFSTMEATIVWTYADDANDFAETVRLVHLRAAKEIFLELQRKNPAITFVNGLTFAPGGGLPVCSDPRDAPESVVATLGRPLGDTEIMIVDPETGMDMLLYETGEIWLRRGSTIVGYSSGKTLLAEAGFLPTKLTGYLDSEGRLILGEVPPSPYKTVTS